MKVQNTKKKLKRFFLQVFKFKIILTFFLIENHIIFINLLENIIFAYIEK